MAYFSVTDTKAPWMKERVIHNDTGIESRKEREREKNNFFTALWMSTQA